MQDGPVNPFSGKRYATDEEVKESLQVMLDTKLPNKTITIFDWNMGCALQKNHQLNTLFPKYDYVVLIDNDLVVNKYYIKTLKVLFDQFKDDKRAGVIQTSFRHSGKTFQSEAEAEKLEDVVSYGYSHRWEYGFYRHTWDCIKQLWGEYIDEIKECDFHDLLYNTGTYKKIRASLNNKRGTTHADYTLELLCRQFDFKGIHTLSLRHKTIGREGIYSFRQGRFDGGRYGNIDLYDIGKVGRYKVRA